jgi:threonine dehydratase
LWDSRETHRQIKPYILQTPLIRAHNLETLINKEVYLKLEFLQPTKSFKVRGACSKALSLDKNELKGLITASGGNHGLGVCYAGKELDIPVVVYLPETTSEDRIKNIKHWGGKPFLFGEAWDEANFEAQKQAEKLGYTYIHPFDDITVVRGQGTIAVEMLDQKNDLDAIVVSVGGGGLISGIGIAARQMKPEIRILGAETVGADAVTQSFNEGRLVTLPEITSIAKTLGAKCTTEITLKRIKAVVDDMQTVTDQEALDALRLILEKEKIPVEPATSCSIAALLEQKFDLTNFSKVGVVLCGANVSLRELEEWNIFQKK